MMSPNYRGVGMDTGVLKAFRRIGIIEGISYLSLLGIAMPLKYLYDMPEAVKVVGMAHGVLFIGYVVLLYLAMKKYGWNIRYAAILFISSLIPFGTFFTDKKLKVFEEMLEKRG